MHTTLLKTAKAKAGGGEISKLPPHKINMANKMIITLHVGREKAKEKEQKVEKETLELRSSKPKYNANFVGRWVIMKVIVGPKKKLRERKKPQQKRRPKKIPHQCSTPHPPHPKKMQRKKKI